MRGMRFEVRTIGFGLAELVFWNGGEEIKVFWNIDRVTDIIVASDDPQLAREFIHHTWSWVVNTLNAGGEIPQWFMKIIDIIAARGFAIQQVSVFNCFPSSPQLQLIIAEACVRHNVTTNNWKSIVASLTAQLQG